MTAEAFPALAGKHDHAHTHAQTHAHSKMKKKRDFAVIDIIITTSFLDVF